MKVWKHSRLDAQLLLLSVAHAATILWTAAAWNGATTGARAGSVLLLVAMTVYNIIVVSHLFTHAAWFEAPALNAAVSMLNSFSIGQSVQAYQLSHVRNHHRFNNDQPQPDGKTLDRSSTYQGGRDGEHAPLYRYALGGAWHGLADSARALGTLWRGCRVGSGEVQLLELAAREQPRRGTELRQVQRDRLFQAAALLACAALSPSWLLLCYVPTLFIAFAVVNVQNYYEHFGADPRSRLTDSVSYYGAPYNLLTFNDGYHQEHHLRPQLHWRELPTVRREFAPQLSQTRRIVSPVPAIVGFLDRRRPHLHGRELVPVEQPLITDEHALRLHQQGR
jgi:fatty acid desaturase